jgi:GLPGLI family protein
MRAKSILVFLFTIFSFNLFCQTNNFSGEVIYEAETIIGNLDTLKVNGFSKKQEIEYRSLLKNQVKIKYKLIFNKNESIFKQIKKLSINENKFNLVEIQVGKGVFYSNTKEDKRLIKKEFSGELFLIDVPKFKWELSQEKKKIGKYICNKAITSIKIMTSRGSSIRKITAWYTVQIPFNYGPKEYNGLPGLILELQQDKLLFKTSKINLLSGNNIKIQKPIKGKKVTLKEFNSIVKKTGINYLRNR